MQIDFAWSTGRHFLSELADNFSLLVLMMPPEELKFSMIDHYYIQTLFLAQKSGKISAQPHIIVKQICFPNGNVLFFYCFLYPRTEYIMKYGAVRKFYQKSSK